MAGSKKAKTKAPKGQTPGAGTGTQTGGQPPKGQTPPVPTLWAGNVPVDDVIKSLPNYGNSGFAATPAGIQAWLVANGVDPMQVSDWMTSPAGTADMLAFTSDPAKFKGDMSGMAQQNVAGASTATDAMNATPTAPGGKPLTGQQLRKMTEGIAQGMNNVGNLKKLEVQTPGLRVTARTRRPAPAAAQTTNPAPNTNQSGGGQAQGGGAAPPAPTPMTPFWDQVEADRQSYRDRNVDPPAWVPATTAIKRNYPNIFGGAAVLGAIGAAGYGYGLGSSSGEQKGPAAPPIIPPNDEQMLRQMMDEEMRGPMPQQNPAGTPPPNNSTLMRVMNSRSV
jgi:hypothetical protein